jgi:hypothetical protein
VKVQHEKNHWKPDEKENTCSVSNFLLQVSEIPTLDSSNEAPIPVVEEGTGKSLFTFCSETASLIKFLTVANIPYTCNDSNGQQYFCDKCSSSLSIDTNPRKIPRRDQVLFTSDFQKQIPCSSSASSLDKIESNSNASCSYSSSSAGFSDGFKPFIELSTLCTECHTRNYSRNLIFVTGEFAVALHQLGFKNVSPSVIDIAISPLDSDSLLSTGESHMVVNFSNNDIQLRPIRISDKPDNLLDLFGHVTGLCLSHDHR